MRTTIENKAQLFAHDEELDAAVCGFGLTDPGETKLAHTGAHDPTPTPYFILEELFGHYAFSHDSHLLDVGCGTGRVLAHFKRGGYAGRATGVELDPDLAAVAQSWTARYDDLDVVNGNALDLDLGEYTDFYLFNPFDTAVLIKFISAVEAQVRQPVTLVHMSDNGETYFYMGRIGWSQVAQGSFQTYRNGRGRCIGVYECPQHYSVWRFDPALLYGTDADQEHDDLH
ncbi:MAG: class I SAM-dependent methyltransferase [Coriobacteriia bacterium]|nr:class I SAM-dependent methyltransferase [Coriobacteriia bacterium]